MIETLNTTTAQSAVAGGFLHIAPTDIAIKHITKFIAGHSILD